jgi:hypothetical protein
VGANPPAAGQKRQKNREMRERPAFLYKRPFFAFSRRIFCELWKKRSEEFLLKKKKPRKTLENRGKMR